LSMALWGEEGEQPQNSLRSEEPFAMDWLTPQVRDIRESTSCVYMAVQFYAAIMVGRVELRLREHFVMTEGWE
jgi:hypothetical protein